MKKSALFSFSLLLFLFLNSLQVEAQSRTTLTQEERNAIDVLFNQGQIGVKSDGWEIDPDLWKGMSYQKRKSFTEKLSIFYKNYTEVGKQMSGFCYFYNMATKKKIARWYKNEYKEY